MTLTRPLTEAEFIDKVTEFAEAAKRADKKRFESQLELGAILVQLQALREAHPNLAGRRTFADLVENEFEIDVSRGYQFVQFHKIDQALRAAGEEPLTVESHARVVAPLHAEPEALVAAVRQARTDADREGKKLTARHLRDARRAVAPETCAPAPGSSAPEDPWPWGADARDRFARVPKAHRADVMESLTLASLSEEVTPDLVAEAAEVVRSERDAKTGRPGWPVVVGVAVAVVEHNRRQLLGDDHPELLDGAPPHAPIADLDVLGDDYLVPADAEGYVPEEGAPRAPLLVVIPTSLCPDALLDTHPGAREKAEGRAEVVVEIGELEAFDGPFLDEVDDDGHRVLDVQAIREASEAAGIRKGLHKAGPGIEWAAKAVNCCTGCSHGCARRFCYASDWALLYFPQAFVPTVWPARLDAFRNSDPPDPDTQPEHLRAWGRTVFHGSMTDLMNRSFPDWWVEAVIDAIAASPAWRVVVLTKLAPRLTDFEWPANAIVGVTVTGPGGVRAAAKALGALSGEADKWVSVEPLFEGYDPAPLLEAGARFFAVGAQTRTRWAGEIQPSPRDVAALGFGVLAGGGHLFMKDNLDWRGHIPFGDADPYAGWSPLSLKREPANARPPARRPVRPKGPGGAVCQEQEAVLS